MTALLTKSRLACARRCKRLHQFQYELGYRPVETEDVLRFGTLLHRGLEAWWLGWQSPAEERLQRALAAVAGEADPYDLVRAQVLLTGYHFRWLGEPYEVLGVEVPFRTELRNPKTGATSRTWELGGQLDVLVRDTRDARTHFIEHKTSGEDISTGSKYWKRLRMDGQISVYFDGARSLGHDVASCIYDVLGKPGLKPLKATPAESRKYTKTGALYASQRLEDETPEEFRARLLEAVAQEPDRYFVRGEVVRLETELAEALSDVWMTGQEIREAELENRWPKNPDACAPTIGECPFFAVCAGEASLDDPTKFRRLTDVHPELSTQDQPGGVV